MFECVGLFYITPILLYGIRRHLAFNVVPLLIVGASVCSFYLKKSGHFDWRTFTRLKDSKAHAASILGFFAIAGATLTGITYVWLPSLFFSFPSSKPILWGVVMLLYPLLAALPQEIVFRCFFFLSGMTYCFPIDTC